MLTSHPLLSFNDAFITFLIFFDNFQVDIRYSKIMFLISLEFYTNEGVSRGNIYSIFSN